MLFLGLGTSLGSVYMIDGKIIPLALGHLMLYKDETLEQHLNRQAYETHGVKKWQHAVHDAVDMLKAAFLADYVVLGGGQAKKLTELPKGARRGSNEMAYIGGVRMWEPDANQQALEADQRGTENKEVSDNSEAKPAESNEAIIKMPAPKAAASNTHKKNEIDAAQEERHHARKSNGSEGK